jgi:hypothetical protein
MPFPNAPLAGATGGANPSVTVAQAQALHGLSYISVAVPVNFNAVGDTPIDIPLPQGFSTYAVDMVFIANASAAINGAKIGLFTQAGGAGAAIVAGGTAVTVSSAAPDTANNMQQIAIGPGLSESFNVHDRATWPGSSHGDRGAVDLCTVLATCSDARGRLE